MDWRWSSLGTTVANVQPTRLVVGRVGARSQFAVATLARQPCLAVVFLGCRRAQISNCDCHHSVGDLELLEDRLLDPKQPLVFSLGVLGLHEAEHLDLVELMHAEDAAGAFAGSSTLAAKAGRETRVAAGQLL